ncbi:acid protease [Mycena albidolilacea]|uniref:Acid protease n=1 Tax=Mycena albidolilacea TaxID=1033008 RepID=A0AAD7AAN1_9AGAR|nr:acid protease [Mycena albidolilacea]
MNLTSLLPLALTLLCVVPGHNANSAPHYPALSPPVARSPGGALPAAPYSVAFSKKVPRRKEKINALSALCKHGGSGHGVEPVSQTTVPLAGSNFDSDYLVNITIGGQNFSLILDSGSADTWVPQQGFQCFNLTGSPVPPATCNFGTTGFNVNASKTFRPFPNVSFNITYGTSEFVAGPVGFDTVSIGGLEVSRQVVPLPNVAAWLGDGILSGIIGLAFPDETSVYNTTEPTMATKENHIPYDPFFFTAVKQKKVEYPFFSIALNRPTPDQEEHDAYDPNLGILAFGGIADVPVLHNTSTTVSVQEFTSNATSADEKFFWYTIPIDSYNFPGSKNVPEARNASLGNDTTILDTGTAVNRIPGPVAAAYAAAFDPPAELTSIAGLTLYLAQCNATVPPFSVTIGGQAFSMDPRDQLLPVVADEQGDVVCVLGTQAQQGGPDISQDFHLLGDTFFRNIVTTFNPIDKEVTLTQRVAY